jgi:hypothetical protein
MARAENRKLTGENKRRFFFSENMKFLSGGPRLRWEDNIKMHIKQEGCEDIDKIQMNQDRVH